MRKKLLRFLCTALMAVVCMSVNAQTSGSCGANATWEYDADETTLTISGTGAMADYTDDPSSTPWAAYRTSVTKVVIGDDITSVGNCAFNCFTALTDVTIGESVETIGIFAFDNCIAEGFTTLNIPNSVTTIKSCAFSNNHLKYVRLGSGLTEIWQEAFMECRYLKYISCCAATPPTIANANVFTAVTPTAIYVPTESVATYQAADKWSAFSGIITYPHGNCGDGEPATDAVTWAFDLGTKKLTLSGTGAIKTYEKNGNVQPEAYPWNDQDGPAATFNPIVNYMWTGIQTVVVGEGITNIPACAFHQQESLMSVSLPSTLKSIGRSAMGETQIWNICLPEGLETIGEYAFLMSTFESISIPSTVTSIGEAAFAYGALTSIGCYASTPPTLGNNAFGDDVSGITSVYVPSAKVQDYKDADGWSAFGEKIKSPAGDCGTSATWSYEMATQTLTIEGTGAIENHSGWESTGMGGQGGGFNPDNFNGYPCGIENVIIGEGITEIPGSAFYMEVGIKNLTLPSTLTAIGTDAFGECEGIETITCNATTPPTLGDGTPGNEIYVFYEMDPNTGDALPISTLTTIIVPAASVAAYKAAAGWSTYAALIVAGGGAPATTTTFTYTATEKITAFDTYANFTGATALKSHDWDEGTGAGTVVYDGTVTALALRALKGAKLTAITIPACVTAIGNRAFENCTTLTTVTFDGTPTVETFGEYAFAGCDALTAFTVPSSVTILGEGMFQSCDELATITIPESVTSLGENCFMYCKKLTTVNFTGTPQVSAISKNMFQYCDALAAIAIPASVTTIGDDAFNGCKALSSVTFTGTSSLTTIGTCAFGGCTSLETITLPESLTTIGAVQEMGGDTYYNGSVFSGAGITSIEIPKNLTTIYGSGHFTNCPITSLTVNAANTKYDSRDGCNAVIETATDKFVLGCVVSTVPDGIKVIGREAYFGETQPFSLTLPESVTTIEERAFHYSTGLKAINIPSGVTEILAETFAQCNFTNLVIPNSVTTIGKMAFAMCESLETLTLGSGLTEIGEWAFGMCSNVTDVYCYANPTNLTWDGTGFADAKATKFHVADVSAWPHETDGDKFYGANVTFVGDLAPAVAGNAVDGVYWATYYNSAANMKADANTTVYKAAINGSSLTLTEIDDKVITAGQAVILKSTGASISMIISAAASADDYSGNVLEGVDAATAVDANYKYYVLSNEGSTLGFYKFAGSTLGANKAFYKTNATGAPEFFAFGETTGMNDVRSKMADVRGEFYNLAGQRVAQPAKGLYIVNGKKVIIK